MYGLWTRLRLCIYTIIKLLQKYVECSVSRQNLDRGTNCLEGLDGYLFSPCILVRPSRQQFFKLVCLMTD